MPAFRAVMFALGLLAVLVGLLWIGQGVGMIRWPSESFMIDRHEWAYKGAGVAVIGLVLLWLNRPGRAR